MQATKKPAAPKKTKAAKTTTAPAEPKEAKAAGAKKPVAVAPSKPISGGVTKKRNNGATKARRVADANKRIIPEKAMRELLHIGGVRALRLGKGALFEFIHETFSKTTAEIARKVVVLLEHSRRKNMTVKDITYVLKHLYGVSIAGVAFDDERKKRRE